MESEAHRVASTEWSVSIPLSCLNDVGPLGRVMFTSVGAKQTLLCPQGSYVRSYNQDRLAGENNQI